MINPFRVLEENDAPGLQELAQAVRLWEPRLDLYRPPRDARLFEPDGTLYAVALSEGMSITTERGTMALGRGDALIVPQALGLEIEPEVNLLAILHDGPPPDHFRERFIQVWGFEHRPAGAVPRPGGGGGLTEVIADEDVRFRIPYAVWDLEGAPVDAPPTTLEITLLVGLGGEPRLVLTEGDSGTILRPGTIAAIGPGAGFRVLGTGRLGRLILRTELAHEARRAPRRAEIRAMSPEYDPGSSAG
jgi:hypothetical protein